MRGIELLETVLSGSSVDFKSRFVLVSVVTTFTDVSSDFSGEVVRLKVYV